ncbi:MAG TPA: hypothetical protein PLX06_13930 [Fimbriimonadaceae bacterium]|nr:hypothetical protein [Fimbriimonadaceae bacterium]
MTTQEVLRNALKEQFRAAIAMLTNCVEICPDDLWTTPNFEIDDGDRTIYRAFWRIAFHGVYFTHLYMGQSVADFRPWPGRRKGYFEGMWHEPWDIEPFEFPRDADPVTKAELLDYIAYVDGLIDANFDRLNLETSDSGVPWYPSLNKLSHELLTLRHLQGHIGQLSELLMARGLDPKWISRVP